MCFEEGVTHDLIQTLKKNKLCLKHHVENCQSDGVILRPGGPKKNLFNFCTSCSG